MFPFPVSKEGAMKKVIVVLMSAFLLIPIVFSGCGGGGGSDGGGVAGLQGTWLGWIEDDNGSVEEFSIQIDGGGNVVGVWIGGLSTGDTGHINEDWDENLFHVLYDVGTPLSHGYMIVDDQHSHATYGDNGSVVSDFYFGVLEKGAAGFPAYASSDIVASYPVGGAYVFTNDSGTWNWVGDNINMTVDQDLTFSGSDSMDTFSGGFNAALFDSNHGRYVGTLTRNTIPTETMDITAFVSTDGTAVAAFAKEIATVPTSLEDYILIGLKE
jgi:hypothetical protein